MPFADGRKRSAAQNAAGILASQAHHLLWRITTACLSWGRASPVAAHHAFPSTWWTHLLLGDELCNAGMKIKCEAC